MLSRIGIALALVCLLKPAATVLSPWAPQDITLPPPPCADTLQISKLTSLLVTISDWIMQSGVGSNQLNNATYWDPPDAIFINANLARVLLAAYKITGNADYVAVGLQWCDSVVNVQQSITTSTGKSGGYWDTGYGAMYFGDTGTAVTALAVCHSLSNRNRTRQVQYSEALAKLANFVTDGCHQIPAKYDAHQRCPPKATGWIVGSTVLTHSHPIILDQQDLIKSL